MPPSERTPSAKIAVTRESLGLRVSLPGIWAEGILFREDEARALYVALGAALPMGQETDAGNEARWQGLYEAARDAKIAWFKDPDSYETETAMRAVESELAMLGRRTEQASSRCAWRECNEPVEADGDLCSMECQRDMFDASARPSSDVSPEMPDMPAPRDFGGTECPHAEVCNGCMSQADVEALIAAERHRWSKVLRAWARETSKWAASGKTESECAMHAWRLSALDDAAEAIEDENDTPFDASPEQPPANPKAPLDPDEHKLVADARGAASRLILRVKGQVPSGRWPTLDDDITAIADACDELQRHLREQDMADVSTREDYERVYVQMRSLVGDLRRQLAAAQELIDAEPGLRPPQGKDKP